MTRQRKMLLVSACVLLIFLLSPTIWNLLGNTATYLQKSGRVVDASTNSGMPNVFVIATASYGGQSFISGTYGGLLYRYITRTDANGIYYIPSSWAHAEFWFPPAPGTAPSTEWRIAVFKPGYAVEGDETSWSNFDNEGQPLYLPRSVGPRTANGFSFGEVKVEPIMMREVRQTLKQSAFYYHAIVGRVREPSLEEYALRKLGFNFFLPQVCNLDLFAKLDLTTINTLRDFSANPIAFDMTMKEAEPENWGKFDTPSPLFLARDVCNAMKVAGEAR
ncbi:MAG: carboxypeptidase-like regulatory domain-containing protein [Rudaea sp.]|nr:carboxypeptidase-like regulatory domain-containing protein [Rudaea sp.]